MSRENLEEGITLLGNQSKVSGHYAPEVLETF